MNEREKRASERASERASGVAAPAKALVHVASRA
jgi:hypothetical protein